MKLVHRIFRRSDKKPEGETHEVAIEYVKDDTLKTNKDKGDDKNKNIDDQTTNQAEPNDQEAPDVNIPIQTTTRVGMN